MKTLANTGKRVYEIYNALGFKTHLDFAKKIGISKAAVGQWFKGKVEPDPKYLIRLMVAFPEINKNFLLFGQRPIFEKMSAMEYNEHALQIKALQRENERLREIIANLVNTVDVLNKFYQAS